MPEQALESLCLFFICESDPGVGLEWVVLAKLLAWGSLWAGSPGSTSSSSTNRWGWRSGHQQPWLLGRWRSSDPGLPLWPGYWVHGAECQCQICHRSGCLASWWLPWQSCSRVAGRACLATSSSRATWNGPLCPQSSQPWWCGPSSKCSTQNSAWLLVQTWLVLPMVLALVQTWLVLIVPRDYMMYILLSRLKIFSCASPMVNLHRHWMLLAEVRYNDPMQVLDKSIRRTFLPLQK